MHPALDMDIGSAGKLAPLQQCHLGPVLILGVLGAVDETGQVPAIQIAETTHLFGQRHQSGQQRHHPLPGVMEHVDPIGTQLHEEIERGIRGLLAVGRLRHKATELGRTGGRVDGIPALGADGDQTAETGLGEIGAHRIPQNRQPGHTGGQLDTVTGAIEHQIEGMQIRLCADPGLGFHFSLQRH